MSIRFTANIQVRYFETRSLHKMGNLKNKIFKLPKLNYESITNTVLLWMKARN